MKSSFPVAVHLLFENQNQILLLRRYNTGYQDGNYSLVAGHVEIGESVTAASIREAEEEVGVKISPQDLIPLLVMHRKSDDERIDFFMKVKKWKGTITNKEPEKCDQLLWANKMRLPSNTIPYIRKAIGKVSQGSWFDEFGWKEENMNLEFHNNQSESTYMNNATKWNIETLRTRGVLDADENIEELLVRILHSISYKDLPYFGAENNSLFIKGLYDLLISGKVIFGTPILAGLGKNENQIFAACTVISIPHTAGIPNYDLLFPKLEFLARNGIGVGMDLSELSNPVSAFEKIDQKLREIDTINKRSRLRPVACMLTLDAEHPEIERFINAKKSVNFSESKCNISIRLDDSFAFNGHLNGNADNRKESVISTIIKSIHQCGEPGVMFWDRMENENPSLSSRYLSTAPCGEIGLLEDDCCFFGYINILEFLDDTGMLDYEKIKSSAEVLTRALDAILDYAIESSAIEVKAVRANRRIGIGIMGFASVLNRLGFSYGGEESIRIAENICEIIEYSTKKQSVFLSIKKGAYPGFASSKYQDKAWRNRKIKFSTGLFSNDAWCELSNEIEKYGLRNSSTVAFPPTGNSSRILGVSPSFEPLLSVKTSLSFSINIENQLGANIHNQKNGFDHQIATEVSLENHIKIASVFQRWADGGASKTLNLASESSLEDVRRSLALSFRNGLKCISIFRENCLDVDFFPKCSPNNSCENDA